MSNWLAVFVGGGLGSCLRYALSLWIPLPKSGFPIATLAANILSCVVLGLAAKYLLPKTFIHDAWKLLILVGFCGGFSTFSTFSRETFLLMNHGQWGQALLYIMVSTGSCILVLWGLESGKF